MTTAADILKTKASQAVYAIPPSASVFEALERMAEKSIGSLLVMDGEHVLGIITERDYARKIALMSRLSRETKVREIMSAPVMYVTPQQTCEECMALMTENRLRHLPVIKHGKVIGLLSIGDLVASIISEQRFIIEQLEHYISGDRAA